MDSIKEFKEDKQKISFWMSKSKLEQLSKEYQTDSITDMFNQLVEEKLESRFSSGDGNRSVITAIGGKNKLAKRIIALMPEHSTYIEPFGNTASILLQKHPTAKEIYNDINGDVTNFFTVLKNDAMALYKECTALPYSESVFRDLINSPVPDDPLQKAVRFFYLNRVGFLGMSGTGFRTNSTAGRSFGKFYYSECERFYAVSKRLQGVEILNRDFRKIIKRYSNHPEAFFLCDPPYNDGTTYYEATFKLKDHSALAQMLTNVKGKAMVLHSKNYQIHKLYTGLGFNFQTIRTKYVSHKIVTDDNGNKVKPETKLYIYMNY